MMGEEEGRGEGMRMGQGDGRMIGEGWGGTLLCHKVSNGTYQTIGNLLSGCISDV